MLLAEIESRRRRGSEGENILDILINAHDGGDRFTDATFAYQGGGRGLPEAQISVLEQLVQNGLQPDLTLYLDMPATVGLTRIDDREHDRMEREQVQIFEAVRSAYLARAAGDPRFRIVDADGTLTEVGSRIQAIVADFLDSEC